jgi:hypothetical protein
VHNFQIVRSNFPIQTHGILGREFMVKFKCKLGYDCWLLSLQSGQSTIELPLLDTIDNKYFIVPARSEVIRRVALENQIDSLVPADEICEGVFCANTIVGKNSLVKVINTTFNDVLVKNFSPKILPLSDFYIFQLKSDRNNEFPNDFNVQNRAEILKKSINWSGVTQDTYNGLRFRTVVQHYRPQRNKIHAPGTSIWKVICSFNFIEPLYNVERCSRKSSCFEGEKNNKIL